MPEHDFQDLPHVKLVSPGADDRTQAMLDLVNQIERKQAEARAAAFEDWARRHIPRMIRGELERVRNLDLVDRLKEWAESDDEQARLMRVLECARHLLTVHDVQPCPGGFSRKSEPIQSPEAVDRWGELWCAVQAHDGAPVLPVSSGDLCEGKPQPPAQGEDEKHEK